MLRAVASRAETTPSQRGTSGEDSVPRLHHADGRVTLIRRFSNTMKFTVFEHAQKP